MPRAFWVEGEAPSGERLGAVAPTGRADAKMPGAVNDSDEAILIVGVGRTADICVEPHTDHIRRERPPSRPFLALEMAVTLSGQRNARALTRRAW